MLCMPLKPLPSPFIFNRPLQRIVSHFICIFGYTSQTGILLLSTLLKLFSQDHSNLPSSRHTFQSLSFSISLQHLEILTTSSHLKKYLPLLSGTPTSDTSTSLPTVCHFVGGHTFLHPPSGFMPFSSSQNELSVSSLFLVAGQVIPFTSVTPTAISMQTLTSSRVLIFRFGHFDSAFKGILFIFTLIMCHSDILPLALGFLLLNEACFIVEL